MVIGNKVPLRIIFKGTPFIPPARPGQGKRSLPRKRSIAAEIAPGNRTRFGHPARSCRLVWKRKAGVTRGGVPFGSRRSGSCTPTMEVNIKQRKSIWMLDDFKCHRDEGFIADLLKRTNTTVILIPGGLTPFLQPLEPACSTRR